MEFTSSQIEAVKVRRRPADTCVVAGPGSGKTTVLVEHFRRLVEAGVDPLRILAITFTEKAAANMRGKLAQAFAGNDELRGRLERAWVSTVHGFCARLLRENAIFAGVDPDFHVMDEQESDRLQSRAGEEALDALLAENPEAARALMRGLATADVAGALLNVYDAMRCAGVPVARLEAYRAPDGPGAGELRELAGRLRGADTVGWTAAQRAHLADIVACCERMCGGDTFAPLVSNLNKLKRGSEAVGLVRELRALAPEVARGALTEYWAGARGTLMGLLARFDAAYRRDKQAAGALDYADLEEHAVRLLECRPEARERIRAQFGRVLMDEFQDTNGLQARLLELVRPPDGFYAVGDINQSIYGFRHAEPAVFARYRDEVAASGRPLVDLRENFRSRAEILRAVETILEGAEGIEPRALAPGREFARSAGPVVELLLASGDDAETVEARWVARRIAELHGTPLAKGPAAFGDFAVLVRNSEVLAGFAAAFDAAGIPYVVSRGKGFYETREVVDLMNLLRVVANPRDEISLAAVLRSPFAEVSDEALLRLRQAGGNSATAPLRSRHSNSEPGGPASGMRGGNLGSALRRLDAAGGYDPEDLDKLLRFRDQLARWREAAAYIGFDRLLLGAIEETGYPWDGGPRAAANIEKFLAYARAASARRTLDEFVEDMQLVRAANPREPEAPPDDALDAVKVMTVHSAKGLEFPVVFVAALHKGFDQSLGGLSFSPRYGLGARWRTPDGGESHDDRFQHAIRQERHEREREESNRLLYVAMTRAEERLVMSAAGCRMWAKLVCDALALDYGAERDGVVDFTSPAGEPWSLRVLATAAAPEPAPAPLRAAEPDAPAPIVVERPAITDQYDGNATVTAVNAFAACPRRYYLTHYLRLPVDGAAGGGGGSSAEFGSQVHALLAGQKVEDAVPEAVELAARFGAGAMGQRAARAARAEREFDFLLAVEDVVLRGQIDLWFEENGELALLDYKTDGVSAEEAPARAEGYAVQLRLYALALARVTGRAPDRAWVYFLRPDVAVPVEVTPARLAEAEETVRRFREAQSEMVFPPCEGPHCRTCAHARAADCGV